MPQASILQMNNSNEHYIQNNAYCRIKNWRSLSDEQRYNTCIISTRILSTYLFISEKETSNFWWKQWIYVSWISPTKLLFHYILAPNKQDEVRYMFNKCYEWWIISIIVLFKYILAPNSQLEVFCMLTNIMTSESFQG